MLIFSLMKPKHTAEPEQPLTPGGLLKYVSIENVIGYTGVFVAVGMAWASLSGDVKANTEARKEMEKDLVVVMRDVAVIVESLETMKENDKERDAEILRELSKIADKIPKGD